MPCRIPSIVATVKLFSDASPPNVSNLSEDYLIVSDPAICGGRPVVKGTRVPVQYVLEFWDLGYSAERIHEQYPTVPLDLVKKVVELLSENRTIKILH